MNKRDYAEHYLDNIYVEHLLIALRGCRALQLSFDACLTEARKQFAREVKAKADATPLDK